MPDLKAVLEEAKEAVWAFHEDFFREPDRARITVGGLGHVLLPTEVAAYSFREDLEAFLGKDFARLALYRLGFQVGRAHAQAFFRFRPSQDLTFRVLAGPFFFAWSGYGDVDLLLAEIRGDEGFLVLWETEDSFSAEEAVRRGLQGRFCHLQAGYSAGWCSEAAGLALGTRELACRAEGVKACRFLIAPEERLPELVPDPRFHRDRRAYTRIAARLRRET